MLYRDCPFVNAIQTVVAPARQGIEREANINVLFSTFLVADIRNKSLDEKDPRAIYGFSSWNAEKSTVDGFDAGKQCLDTIKNLKDKIPELIKIKSLYDVTFNIIIVPYIYNEQAPYISLEKEIIELWSKSNTIEDKIFKKYLYSTSDITEHWYIEQDSNIVECYIGEEKIADQSLKKYCGPKAV